MAIYITSFKSPDVPLAIKRQKIHEEQLDWFLAHSNMHIYVALNGLVTDCYDPKYQYHPRITYFEMPKSYDFWSNSVKADYFMPMHNAGPDEWSIFADDDAWLHSKSYAEHCDGATFLFDLEQNPHKFGLLDIFGPTDGRNSPYLHKLASNDLDMRLNYRFIRTKRIKGSLIFVRRRDEPVINWMSGAQWFQGEDLIFTGRNYLNGNQVHLCCNIYLREKGPSTYATQAQRAHYLRVALANRNRWFNTYGHPSDILTLDAKLRTSKRTRIKK